MLCVCLAALKWKRCAAIHDTQALKAATGMKALKPILSPLSSFSLLSPLFLSLGRCNSQLTVVVVVVVVVHANRYICHADFDYKFRPKATAEFSVMLNLDIQKGGKWGVT